MNNKLFYLTLVPLLFSCVSCNTQNKEEPDDDKFIPEVYEFEKVKNVANEGFYLEPGESQTLHINYELIDKNYLRLDVLTSVNLYGVFEYRNIENFDEKGEETFYIPASEEKQEYRHFLDAYRPEYNHHDGCSANSGAHKYYNIPMETKMAVGAFKKDLRTITIKNVSNVGGSVELTGLYVSDRQLPKKEVHLKKGYLEIGSDLMGGGTLTYLERHNYQTSKQTYNIDEILTEEGDVYIGVNAESLTFGGGQLGSEDHHVNLINYYDAGRQIQQSFYAAIGGSNLATHGENGYTRKYCFTGSSDGYFWPYNPVQGGDCHCNISQLIDYQITENSIYIKAKPLDWADNNCVTDSYMENWYTIENNNIIVKNRFVNYAGFTDMEKCNNVQLELPATYICHPLHTLVTYQGETPWTDDQAGLILQPNLGSWAKSAEITRNHPEDWFAWVNDDKFGVGMYIPDITYYASGRSNPSTNVSVNINSDAYTSPMGNPDLLMYNKKECTYRYQSCYTRNTCYTAPEIQTRMLDYLPFEYSYALCVDYLPVIRNSFRNLYRANAIDNSSMFIWDEHI